MSAAELRVWDGPATMEHFADVRGVYHLAHPRHSLADHRDLLTRQAAAPGFMTVAAFEGEHLVGCVYGGPLQLGTRWWHGLEPHQGADFSWEDGMRTFAVLDLCLVPGSPAELGDELARALLSHRREQRATTKSPVAAGIASLGWGRRGSAPGPEHDVVVWVRELPV